jgi:hypothetical protein
VDQHLLLFVVADVLFLLIVVSLVMAWWSGWALLSKRFKAQGTFTGSRRWGQSGQMRWMAGYRRILIVGANSEGLYVATLPFFPLFHPALFIPWSEIHVANRSPVVFAGVGFELGNELCLPLYVYGAVVDDLKKAAGAAWPAAKMLA